MFDPDAIRRAVALSQLGHDLVQWLGDVVAAGGLSFGRAHGTMSVQTAARDWIERNFSTLPARCRPDDADVPAFANLVSTYFLTSFELTPPGQKRMRSDGCWCNWCTWVESASSLRPKKLTPRDRELAHELCAAYARERAESLGWPFVDELATAILASPDLREPLAMGAWTRELLRRLDGFVTGPAVLALWRMFAWTPEGAPKSRFTLSAELLLGADATVASAIEHAAGRA